jgi:hypothetical protein
MKSPKKALRQAYYTKLTSLTYNGNAVRVIGNATSDLKASPYVQLSTQTNRQEIGKTGFNQTCTMLLDVVGVFDTNISEAIVDDLADLIIQNIVTDEMSDYLSLSPDFNLVTSQLIGDNDLSEGDDKRVYYRRLLRFEHKIEEL